MEAKLGEFDLIWRFFKAGSESMAQTQINRVLLGIGDDCALLQSDATQSLAVTSDMLVEGRHFFAGANAEWLGHKALAVNLSDLAAMGAKPVGFTLALALPNANADWLAQFSQGLFRLAQQWQCPLIGGDTTQGPLTICITALGHVPAGSAIKRSGAKTGDDIWVSGTLGDARLALGALRKEWSLNPSSLETVLPRMHEPEPRIALGMQLRGIANSALDVSDGLLGDLRHILKASQVNAEVLIDQLPASRTLAEQTQDLRRQCAANGGDDYELCFTAPASKRMEVESLSTALLPLTRIGSITSASNGAEPELILRDANGNPLTNADSMRLTQSFDHFKST
ncbi:thiamine-phosphate kinase [Polynucleobacter sp.]|uniref:thiamine-phosphate kinase n=1 Tax=Polynucleobacter sp. TaxID=2029855 RepID=UPI002736FDCC|nr:thiamine-phosphate kinase [Polynucleobacter sp.]MDP3122782.1 thiamine-phosphate kinase [Polynucleobacter sp.]